MIMLPKHHRHPLQIAEEEFRALQQQIGFAKSLLVPSSSPRLTRAADVFVTIRQQYAQFIDKYQSQHQPYKYQHPMIPDFIQRLNNDIDLLNTIAENTIQRVQDSRRAHRERHQLEREELIDMYQEHRQDIQDLERLQQAQEHMINTYYAEIEQLEIQEETLFAHAQQQDEKQQQDEEQGV